jgi:ABC-type transporter Mla subunit MlaD
MELRTRKILAAVLGIFIFCALLAFSILHFRLVDLKEVFLTKVSSEFTSRIGQEVRIEGVTIGPLSAITFHQAVIKSTNNFEQTFLTIKKIRIIFGWAHF